MSKGILRSRGLCIIPEGRVNKYCKDVGYPYEVTDIKLLSEILNYSREKNLDVFYLSSMYGISYADDIVKKPKRAIYKFTNEEYKRWSNIIAEEIVRKCIQCQTSKVYIMCMYNNLDMVFKILSSRGVEVITPIMGCTLNTAKIKLLT